MATRGPTAEGRGPAAPQAPDDDGLGEPVEVPRGGLRDRIRAKPGLRHAYRLTVFVVGLMFIALGLALAVLPGPLTIPPVLLGLWIWSTEFRFAQRFFDSFKAKASEAWAHVKRRPASSALITVVGLGAAAAAGWAIAHYELIAKAKDAIGL